MLAGRRITLITGRRPVSLRVRPRLPDRWEDVRLQAARLFEQGVDADQIAKTCG
jgi:hypothetical protein